MLDEVSPLVFEECWKVVAERYYGCPVEVTAAAGDEGRDLLIHHPKGLIVAECKLYGTSRVGRPVVQKLHSAVITAGSTHGTAPGRRRRGIDCSRPVHPGRVDFYPWRCHP